MGEGYNGQSNSTILNASPHFTFIERFILRKWAFVP